eukprot:6214720-Pleurochrysis_carterae.AAC.5
MHCFGEHVTSHRERPSRPPFVVMQNHLCMVVSFRGAHFQKNYALRACDSSRRAVVVAGCASASGGNKERASLFSREGAR